jgi:hypothetical protein
MGFEPALECRNSFDWRTGFRTDPPKVQPVSFTSLWITFFGTRLPDDQIGVARSGSHDGYTVAAS